MENDTLKIGDMVEVRTGWGFGPTVRVEVAGITTAIRFKNDAGIESKTVPWEYLKDSKSTVITYALDGRGHWAYGHQVSRIPQGAPKAPAVMVLALLASLAFPTLSRASGACLEAGNERVQVTDKAGKKHHLTLFILGEESKEEFAQFIKSRKMAAMDPGRMVYVKAVGDSLVKFPDVQDCPTKKRGKLKL